VGIRMLLRTEQLSGIGGHKSKSRRYRRMQPRTALCLINSEMKSWWVLVVLSYVFPLVASVNSNSEDWR
jgi:hypothetical protein